MYRKLGKQLKTYSAVIIILVMLLFTGAAVYFGYNLLSGVTVDIVKDNTIISQATYFTPLVASLLGILLSGLVLWPLRAVGDVLISTDRVIDTVKEQAEFSNRAEFYRKADDEIKKNAEKAREVVEKQEEKPVIEEKVEQPKVEVVPEVVEEPKEVVEESKEEVKEEEPVEEEKPEEIVDVSEMLQAVEEKDPKEVLDEKLHEFFSKFKVSEEQIQALYKLITKISISDSGVIVTTKKPTGEEVKSKIPPEVFEEVSKDQEKLQKAVSIFPNLEEVELN